MNKFFLQFSIIVSFFSLLLIYTPYSAAGAVVLDNSSANAAFDGAGLSTLTWNHTIGTGPSKALFVGISTFTSTIPVGVPSQKVVSVLYNGLALTRVGTQLSPATGTNSVEMFRLTNPPTGSVNVVVTFANVLGNPFVNYAVGSSVSFNGVDQNAPNGAFVSSAGTSATPAVSVSDSVAGDVVFDTLSANFNTQFLTAGANQSVCTGAVETTCRRGRRFYSFSSDVGASSLQAGNAGSLLMNWTLVNSNDWALGAFAVKSLPTTAATGSIRGRVLTNDQRGISRVLISLTTESGSNLTTLTNPFGYFRFQDLEIGETYIIQAQSKSYIFPPNVVTLNEDLQQLNLFPIGK